MRGKVLFYLPSDLEMLFAAIAVIQGFALLKKEQVKHGMIPQAPQIWVDNPNPQFTRYLPALGEHQVCSPNYVPSRSECDLVFSFDVENAHALSIAPDIHITQAFAIQLGTPPQPIPDLSMVQTEAPVVDVGIYDVKGSHLVKEWLAVKHPEKSFKDMGMHDSPEQAKMILGQQCAATYFACAIGRDVVELVPAIKNPRWLSKWTHPGYVMLYGTSAVEQIAVAMEALWGHTTAARLVHQQSETQTERITSDAGSAEGSSAVEETHCSQPSTSV